MNELIIEWTGPGWYVIEGDPPRMFQVLSARLTPQQVVINTSQIRWHYGTPTYFSEEDLQMLLDQQYG